MCVSSVATAATTTLILASRLDVLLLFSITRCLCLTLHLLRGVTAVQQGWSASGRAASVAGPYAERGSGRGWGLQKRTPSSDGASFDGLRPSQKPPHAQKRPATPPTGRLPTILPASPERKWTRRGAGAKHPHPSCSHQARAPFEFARQALTPTAAAAAAAPSLVVATASRLPAAAAAATTLAAPGGRQTVKSGVPQTRPPGGSCGGSRHPRPQARPPTPPAPARCQWQRRRGQQQRPHPMWRLSAAPRSWCQRRRGRVWQKAVATRMREESGVAAADQMTVWEMEPSARRWNSITSFSITKIATVSATDRTGLTDSAAATAVATAAAARRQHCRGDLRNEG